MIVCIDSIAYFKRRAAGWFHSWMCQSLRALWRDTVAAVAAPGMGSLLVLFAFAVSTYWTLSVLLNETLSAKGFSSREIMLPGVMLRPTRLRLHTRPPASACASHKLVVWCIYMQVCLGRLNSM